MASNLLTGIVKVTGSVSILAVKELRKFQVSIIKITYQELKVEEIKTLKQN